MGRNVSNHSVSPIRGRGSPHRKSPSRRERSPNARHGNSYRGESPAREKLRDNVKPAKHKRSVSPISRSPSPRSKRLRRVQAEKENERSVSPVPRSSSPRSQRLRRVQAEREHERSHLRRDGERGLEKDKKSGRDDNERKSSTSRHGRRSRSPQPPRDREGEKGHVKKYERNNSRGSDRERDGNTTTDRKSGRDDTDHRARKKSRSQSPQPRPRDEVPTSRGAERRNDEDDSISRMQATEEALAQKEKPSFELSGKLAAETNRVRGVTLLFNEPPDACKPNIRWRLYVFKNGEALNDPLYIHRQSCYLFGRERRVADIPTDHPSCSKQHAVIQFRKVDREKPDGMLEKQIRPYLMDLGSTNKTFINDGPIEPERYYELHEQDTIKFGNSSREYVLLHENSAP